MAVSQPAGTASANDRMMQAIGQQLTDDQKAFLVFFKSGDPQRDLLEHAIARELFAAGYITVVGSLAGLVL